MVTLVAVARRNAMTFKDVRLRALQDSPGAFGSTYAKESQLTDPEWIKHAAERDGANSTTYLAMDGDISCGIVAGFLDKLDNTRAHLVSMWVAPDQRRLGVGRLLVDGVLNWARARKVHILLLMVTCNNNSAIDFYERIGFKKTGRTEPYPNDCALFEYEMSRLIQAPLNDQL